MSVDSSLERVRLDRWLWAARFFKTRALAKAAIEGGKVKVDGNKPKVAKEIVVGSQLTVQRGDFEYEITVDALSDKRGNATIAATLYTESADSAERRLRVSAERRMLRAGLRVPQTKPNKHDRRALQDLKKQPSDTIDDVSDHD